MSGIWCMTENICNIKQDNEQEIKNKRNKYKNRRKVYLFVRSSTHWNLDYVYF